MEFGVGLDKHHSRGLSAQPTTAILEIGPNWARSGEFGTADVEAVADTAMSLLDGTGVRMLIHDPASSIERAPSCLPASWVASGLLASRPER